MSDFERPQDPSVVVIEIDYPPASPDPARIFRSMAALVEAFQAFDLHVARSTVPSLEVQLLLERVSEGSIRGFFRLLLEQLDDDALRTLDWKPLVGQYLVKAKHALLRWLEKRDRILTRDELIELQEILAKLAPGGLVIGLLPPGTVPLETLLVDIQAISKGVRELRETDDAIVRSSIDKTPINKSFRLDDVEIARLLIKDTILANDELVLPVKKPDYLGRSMWEFRLGDHNIEARISDDTWLERFQRGDIPLAPGDAIRAVVRTEISRDYEGDVVDIHRTVLEVRGVVRGPHAEQQRLIS